VDFKHVDFKHPYVAHCHTAVQRLPDRTSKTILVVVANIDLAKDTGRETELCDAVAEFIRDGSIDSAAFAQGEILHNHLSPKK
jgi:hypothetical protein